MKELLSATVTRDGRIEATYKRESLGAVTPTSKRGDWPESVKTAGQALLQAADDLSPDDPKVQEVQVYGPPSDPGGTDHAAPGELVDVRFSGGSGARAGESAPVPTALATARDAFKSAVMAAV